MVYNYAADKQITAEQIAGDLLPSTGFTAQYDAGNRITNWNRTTVPPTSPSVQQWSYDNAGNWNSTARTIGNNTTTENRTHSAADQINTIAGNAATHDLKGNLTEYEIDGKEYTVEYDLDNRIVKVEVDNDDVEYRYDAFGRRVIRKEGSTNTSLIWWGNSECAEHKHQAGTTVIQNDIMEHPSRLNSVIARAVDGSKFKLEWYHKNYLDHVYAVSDDSGDILEHYRYTAFGEVTIYDENGAQVSTTQIDNHILWNTRRRDEVTGYYMYKFRHYSAELGRWPSRDPIEEDGGINLYGFVGNSPIEYWDLLGLVNTNVDGQQHHWFPQKHRKIMKKKCPKVNIDNYVTMMGGHTHGWLEDTNGYGQAWDLFMATNPDCCRILNFGLVMLIASNLEMQYKYKQDSKFWYKFIQGQSLLHPYRKDVKDFTSQLAPLFMDIARECSCKASRNNTIPESASNYINNLSVNRPQMESSTGSSTSNSGMDYGKERLAVRRDRYYTDFYRESRSSTPDKDKLIDLAEELRKRHGRRALPPNVIEFVPTRETREAARRQRRAR